MPASYKLYPGKKLIVVTYSGDLSLEDIMAIRQQGMADPEFDPDFDVIDDVSAVNTADIRYDELNLISGKSVANTGVKRALIAVTDFQKGMSNMYKVLSESHGHFFRVFDDVDKARDWIEGNSE